MAALVAGGGRLLSMVGEVSWASFGRHVASAHEVIAGVVSEGGIGMGDPNGFGTLDTRPRGHFPYLSIQFTARQFLNAEQTGEISPNLISKHKHIKACETGSIKTIIHPDSLAIPSVISNFN